tara:strand:+ start:140 stop:340 length:201 start_codon:yes stop_codon:yes gene_type:complete
MVEIITIKELAKDLKFSERSCKRMIAKLQKDNPQVKALHRFRLKTQIFTKEDVGKVMELCLNLNQE